ncbi:hypothetical protein QFZ37_002064 [Chryseobacterium ginsenosidimutans]|nr:hypothetical protein [Chryseobacterium ginsenosidimutans]MDQ0593695.1 hypothetical protein [Chryseobacterium ginsenosidimutans]
MVFQRYWEQREASVEVLDKLAKFYDITVDEIVNFEDKNYPQKSGCTG